MSIWENSLIDEYGSRRNSYLAPLRQNAIRKPSKEKKLSRHNDLRSQDGQVHQDSRGTTKLVIFNDQDITRTATQVTAKEPDEEVVQQNSADNESLHPPRQDDSALPRRPPLAVLPVNRLLTLESIPLSSPQKDPLKQATSSYKRSNNSPFHKAGSTPRKVLWPVEHIRRVPRSTYAPMHITSTNQLQSYQSFRPQKCRSPLKAQAKSARSQRQRYRKTNLSHMLHASNKNNMNCTRRNFHPMDETEIQIPEKDIQIFPVDNSHGHLENANNPPSPPPQKRSKLLEMLQRRLVQPLSALRTRKPPSNDPHPTPTTPSFVVRSVVRQTDTHAPPDFEPRISQPEKTAPKDQRRRLQRWEIYLYRVVFGVLLVMLNVALLIVYLCTPKHPYLLAFLILMKSKDLLSTIAGVLAAAWNYTYSLFKPPPDVSQKWVVSIICAYAESETQIMKTVDSLIKQDLVQHKQVICVILDGKPRDILPRFTNVAMNIRRSYLTWNGERNNLEICAGSIHGTPIMLIQKSKNAGKKDTLILGHSLFNYPREDAPIDIKILRRDVWTHILPSLVASEDFTDFHYVYATDADSTLHKDCIRELVNALSRRPRAIAACGLIIAQIKDNSEWSPWHLFQQFQYTFGQFVRRQAESVWGRVTCLPGPVTMVKVRPEMANAISEYASPVTNANIFLQQVQYQGTDRRLTWCMLAQARHLQTILVPTAIGETIVPRTLDHYLSQRRRWAANAFFNDFMYTFGRHQHPFTRLFGVIDIIRMSFVYYRVVNTALFVHSLIRHFYLAKIIPTIIVTKSPTTWFLLTILVKEPILRKRLHKIICGLTLNLVMSPVLSIIVFSKVVLSLGNHAWGTTGVGAKDEGSLSMMYLAPATPKSSWSPTRLVAIIKNAIHPSPAQNTEPEKVTQRHSTDSEAPKRTSTAASKASINSNSSQDPRNIPLPATPQTPTPILPVAVVTRISRSTAAHNTPTSNGRRRSEPSKVLTVIRTPSSKEFHALSTPLRSSILIENPNPESSLRKRARYPTFIVEPP